MNKLQIMGLGLAGALTSSISVFLFTLQTPEVSPNKAILDASVHDIALTKSVPTPVFSDLTNVALGFNNAAQLVEREDGTFVTIVADGKLLGVERASDGGERKRTILAEGDIILPAVATSDDVIVVAWVERMGKRTSVYARISFDGGGTFGEKSMLSQGVSSSAVSLAAEGTLLYATWHEELSEATSAIFVRSFDASLRVWSAPIRIDDSSAKPLWPSIAVADRSVVVTWRDNRESSSAARTSQPYRVWMRFSDDAGKTWNAVQRVLERESGDPSVCLQDGGNTVSIAFHGGGSVWLIRSVDKGHTFGMPMRVGDGWFAHVSCTPGGLAMSWEETQGQARSGEKRAGWAFFDHKGNRVKSGVEDPVGGAASVLVLLHQALDTFELLWIVPGEGPLSGTLTSQKMNIEI